MKIFVVVVNEWASHEYDNYENVLFYLDEQKANAERDRLNNEYGRSDRYSGTCYYVIGYDVVV